MEELGSRRFFSEHSRETFDAFLEVSEQIATREFAPHNALSDQSEPVFDGEDVHLIPEVGRALSAFNAAGLGAAPLDSRFGGQQLPVSVYRACFAWFQAANISTAAYPMLNLAAANLLIAHASSGHVDRFVPALAEGRFFGTMCLSEPQAGSSLADVTTRAEPVGDGSYRLVGTKMWISAGDHDLAENIVHLVLARTSSVGGVKGLSLFIVPKRLVDEGGGVGERNDVTLAGINHKMGYRGTVNTVLNFGEGRYEPGGQPGAVGYLVGEEGAGLSYMFHMMNEARIAIGTGAAAIGYAGYLQALDYARNRPQGRPLGTSDPGQPQVPIIQHPDVRRMLLASKSYVEGALALVLYAARLLDEEQTGEAPQTRADARTLLDVLTPIVKSWPSQWCLAANDLAIQIHGGYGYTREYLVEQLYRDNRLNPIHEGTHGIQAQDLLGRKVVLDGGAGLALLLEAIESACKGATSMGDARLSRWAGELRSAATRIEAVTKSLWDGGRREVALANATVYLEAVGHVVMAWMWLELAATSHGAVGDFYDGKRAAAEYFFEYELPKVHPQFDLLERADTMLLDLEEAWF